MNLIQREAAAAATDLRQTLPRNRLTDQILASQHSIFWIGAPKGMGKSILLEQLYQQLAQRQDPQRILLIHSNDVDGPDYVLQCLRGHLQKHARQTRPELVSLSSVKEPLHLLIDGLDTRQHSALIRYLIESSHHLPAETKLYLAVDDFVPLPAIPPSSLYDDGRLQTITLRDLRMTREEIVDLLKLRNQYSTSQQAERLLQKSDGIPAVLALLLDHAQDPAIQKCQILSTWIDENLLLYMEPMEVLRLASLSILGQFDLRQASQLIGVAEGATLNWLQRYKPLLFRYSEDASTNDEARFSWSQLMQPFFFHCLLNRYRDLLPRIIKRAEPWLLDDSINPLFVEHLIHSVEKPWAKEILLSRCQSWYEKRDAAAIIQLMEQVPESMRLAMTVPALYYAWALILQKRVDSANRWLDKVEMQTFNVDDNLTVLRALAAVAEHPRPTYHVRSALLESCLERNSLFQGEVLSLYSNMLHAVGASSLSKNALKKAIHFHQVNQNPSHLSHARCLLWRCEFNEGNTTHATERTGAYLHQLQQPKPMTNSTQKEAVERQAIAMVQSSLAEFLYESNELAEAESLYLSAIPELIQSEWEYESVVAQVGLTRLYISRAQHQLALDEIERIKNRIRHRENTSLNAVLCFETMRILRQQGKSVLPAAAEYEMDIDHLSVESLFEHTHDKERLYWIKCYILVLLEQRNHTSALIYEVKGLIKSLHLMDNRNRTLFSAIKALCEFKLGQHDGAGKSISEAMHLAQSHRFMRTLINDDFGWTELWQAVDQKQGFKAHIVPSFISELRTLLQPHSAESAAPMAAEENTATTIANYRRLGLTDKEFGILQLLAEGLCNKTIASRSEIALTTVKWHLQNIFGKLQARNRTEAVVKAQEYDLIGKSDS